MDVVGASMIVEDDPLAGPLSSLPAAREGMQRDALVFERAPQPLDEDVVEEPPASVHRDPNPCFLQALGPGPGGELAVQCLGVVPDSLAKFDNVSRISSDDRSGTSRPGRVWSEARRP